VITVKGEIVVKDFPCWLFVIALVLAVSLCVPGQCRAGRVELCLDSGPRGFSYWWKHFASPDETFGIGVKFAPEVYPCVVRTASVLVDSTDEFRIHVMDGQGVDLVPPATASALEPCTFAVAEFPAGITIESGEFYVLAEPVSPTPSIGTARGKAGVLPQTYLWSSMRGFFQQNNSAAVIRALVDQPIRVAWPKGSGTDASNQHLFLAFDSDMDASTINSNNITIELPPQIDVPVPAGTWLYDEQLRRAEFVPDSPFPYTGFFYHVTVSEEVKDIYDNRLAAPWSGSFSVKLELDEDPPVQPLSVSFSACDAAIEISWGGNMALDTVGYYIYSATWAAGADLAAWLAQAEKVDVGNVLSTRVENLTNDVVHGVAVSAYDYCRNEGEAVYGNRVPHRGSVLLVVEETSPGTSPEGEQRLVSEMVAAMQSAAFDYTLYEEAKSGLLPESEYLSAFDSVFWERGIRFWAQEFEATPLLTQYMQGAGRLNYDTWALIYFANENDPFFSDWLHLISRDTDFHAFNVVGVPNDPIGDGLDLVYTSDDSFAAQIPWFEPKDGAVGFLHVKDKADEVCGLHYADTGDYGYRLVFSTAILPFVYNTDDRDKLMSRGLCWLEGKDIDFRIASNTRVIQLYSVLELFVSANTLAGVEADVDAYLAVLFELEGASGLIFYDGAGFVSEMTAFVSGVHLESGLFLPRTKVFEYLYRGGLPSGKYTFFVALTQAGTQTFLTDPRGTIVFMK